MRQRSERPDGNNLYFITTTKGGYNQGRKGKNFDTKQPDELCDALPNNVNYAIGRYHEVAHSNNVIILPYLENVDNLVTFALSKGILTGTVPQEGAIACWRKGETSYLAVVEECGENSMTVSHSIQGSSPFELSFVENGNSRAWVTDEFLSDYTFITFIYNPYIYSHKPVQQPSGDEQPKKKTRKKKSEEIVNESEVQSEINETN